MRGKLVKIFTLDTRVIELLHAALLTVWTFMLLTPHNTFRSSPSFETLEYVADETIWGLMGLITLTVILFGVWTDSIKLRRLGSMTGVLWWGTVATGLILSTPTSTSGWVYLVFTHFLGWAYIQARGGYHVRFDTDT